MNDRIHKTIDFLLNCFENPNEYWSERPEHKPYRIEHSFRVAHIGAEIAQREGFDRDAAVVACLLHDVSYAFPFESPEEFDNHGQKSAKIARGFVESLGFDKELSDNILYGIAIHTNGDAGFDGTRTPLAFTVSDADNIDRFDCIRIYEGVRSMNIENTPKDKLTEQLARRIARLAELKDYPFGTETGAEMWRDKLNFQSEYFKRMLAQINISGAQGL